MAGYHWIQRSNGFTELAYWDGWSWSLASGSKLNGLFEVLNTQPMAAVMVRLTA